MRKSLDTGPARRRGIGVARRGALDALVPAALCWLAIQPAAAQTVTLEKHDDRVRVFVDGEPFTDYVFDAFGRPVLYPVVGPHGIAMTRHFPMKTDVPGEAHDHPHHTSIWYTYAPVNGVNFFAVGPEMGKCVHDAILAIESGGPRGTLKTTTRWVAPDGRIVLTDTRALGFEVAGGARMIDFDVTLHASHGDVVIGDSKHGGLAVRTHPNLQLAAADSSVEAKGRALNSEGVTAGPEAGSGGGAVFGRRARWIDYWAAIEGHTVGLAMFDHPSNPRHPTYWMARGYGYVAACPLGRHTFDGEAPGTGDLTIPAGQSVRFRYRLVLHEGDPTEAGIEAMWQAYADTE